jgi:hypothetical protein
VSIFRDIFLGTEFSFSRREAMPIKFNSLLADAGIAPGETVLLRHQDQNAARGRSPYELWRDDRPAFECYQSTQSFANRSRLVRPRYWASFVGSSDGGTMFVGIYHAAYRGILTHDLPKPHAPGQIDEAGSCDVYDLAIDAGFVDLEAKLFIDWGDGARSWIQRAERHDKAVIELRTEFREPAFPGFLNFMSPLSRIDRLPPGWITTLAQARGVYLLTCPNTREQYVGKASGGEGFWHRWQEYCRTGHGNNVALKSRNPSDYQVSILEVAGSAATDDEIAAMEVRWKAKLQSREMGLNRN